MLSTRSLVLAALILIGYFYFLNSEHKNRMLNSLGRLIEVENAPRPMASSIPAAPAPPPPAQAPTPAPSSSPAAIVAADPVLPEIEALSLQEIYGRPPLAKEQLQKYLTTSFFQQDQFSFYVLRLRAVLKNLYTPAMGTLIDERATMVVFDPSPSFSSTLVTTYPVVMKSTNGQLGIVSGTLIVKLKDISHAGHLALRFGLGLKAQDDSLKLAYLVVPRPDQVGAFIKPLREYPGVKWVKAEIIQSWKMSRVEKFDGATRPISK